VVWVGTEDWEGMVEGWEGGGDWVVMVALEVGWEVVAAWEF
jgi:hypothetical protein